MELAKFARAEQRFGMPHLNDFYNDGFGWVCRHCERELATPAAVSSSRLLSEGEGETRLSNPALAKWADPEQRILVCPRCGISELADRS